MVTHNFPDVLLRASFLLRALFRRAFLLEGSNPVVISDHLFRASAPFRRSSVARFGAITAILQATSQSWRLTVELHCMLETYNTKTRSQ